MDRPRVILLYHFFHPDDVVSARHFSDLALGLDERGWDVVAMPCRWACRYQRHFPSREPWHGVDIDRVSRPGFRQASGMGRLVNAAWMLAAWGLRAATHPRTRREVVVVGTDPMLGILAVLPWRFFRRRTSAAHWCFDLYPEAAVADGWIREGAWPLRLLSPWLKLAYRRCGLIADLGSCMRARLLRYQSPAPHVTLTPWALAEPDRPPEPDPEVRQSLFGSARLTLLYSGTFGRAHGYEEFLSLARELRGGRIHFSFAGRGNRSDELRRAVTADDANISFAGFAPEAELEKRLAACDVHLVSLRPEWTGTVVPSKFFGALAVGRAVLFAGSEDSAIAGWIRTHRVGWVLSERTQVAVRDELLALADNPHRLHALRVHCHQVYHTHFSRRRMLDAWDRHLRSLLPAC